MAQNIDISKLTEKLHNSQGLPKNIQTEAHLWDAILKKEVFFMPEQLFPLIHEIYGKSYEKFVSVAPLATEYPIDHIKTQKISSIRSDVAVMVDARDIFHFECESKKDKNIAIRIFEYDTRIALSYNVASHTLQFPHSALLSLAHKGNIPKSLSLNLHFRENIAYTYQIPVLNIHSYSLEDIRKKHLSILIPFLPIQFRKSLQSKKGRQKVSKNELTSFYQKIILILDEEIKNNYLNEYDQKVILELLRKSLIRVFYQDNYLLKEVLTMTEPVLKLEHEEYYYAMKLQKDELFRIERELAKKKAELAETQSELTKSQSQLTQSQSELTKSQSELTKSRSELTKSQSELTKSQSELTKSQSELTKSQSELSKRNEQLLQKNNEISLLKHQIKELQKNH